jgi:proteasome lid subunit RPN8/RPN11
VAVTLSTVGGRSYAATSLSTMRIPKAIAEEMEEHARAEVPNECCGLIGAENGELTTLYRAKNSQPSPFSYNLDPQDQFRIMREMEDRGEELAVIYHSHTKSEASPSQTDINLATYPDALYVIVSLKEGEATPRGFWIDRDAGSFEEEALVVD